MSSTKLADAGLIDRKVFEEEAARRRVQTGLIFMSPGGASTAEVITGWVSPGSSNAADALAGYGEHRKPRKTSRPISGSRL